MKKEASIVLAAAAVVAVLGMRSRATEAGQDDGAVQKLMDYLGTIKSMAQGKPTAISDAARAMLKRLEGFAATPYWDHKGYSIGYGHLMRDGESMTRVNEAQADALLSADLGPVENAVANAVTVELNQSQFDALVLWAYNVGVGAMRKSTLLKKLNAGDYDGAASEFSRWIFAGGVVNAGLVARRTEEQRLFG